MGTLTLQNGVPLLLGNSSAQFQTWTPPTAPATFTYYIDNINGNDSNNGTSTITPWRSLNTFKVKKLLPGDSVGIKRGCVCRETLTITSSGTQDAPILVGAYGVGDMPRVTGGVIIFPTTVVSTDANGLSVYSISATVTPNIVVVGGSPFLRNATATDPSQLNPGEWVFLSLTIYLKQNVVGALPTVEVPGRTGVMCFDGQHDIVFRDLQVDLAADRAVRGTPAYRITLMNMNVVNCCRGTVNGAIGFIGGSDCKVLNVTMRNIINTLAIYSGGHSGLEIAYCDIRCDPGPGVHENVIHLDGSTPPSERYFIHHNYLDMLSSATAKPIINVGQSSDFALHTAGGYILYNTLNGGNAGISINNSGTATDPIVVQYNVIQNFGLIRGDTWPGGLYSPMAYDQQYILVSNNVFSNGVNGIFMQDSSMPDGSVVTPGTHQRANVVFQGNTFSNMSAYSFWCASQISGSFIGNTITNAAHPLTVGATIAGQTWTVSGNTVNGVPG